MGIPKFSLHQQSAHTAQVKKFEHGPIQITSHYTIRTEQTPCSSAPYLSSLSSWQRVILYICHRTYNIPASNPVSQSVSSVPVRALTAIDVCVCLCVDACIKLYTQLFIYVFFPSKVYGVPPNVFDFECSSKIAVKRCGGCKCYTLLPHRVL